jgi:hypothetical protein
MYAEARLRKWWDRLTDGQRAHLRAAIAEDDLEPTTVRMLTETDCPVGPVGTTWDAQPEYGWSWPGIVRNFVSEQ